MKLKVNKLLFQHSIKLSRRKHMGNPSTGLMDVSAFAKIVSFSSFKYFFSDTETLLACEQKSKSAFFKLPEPYCEKQ